ncbi:amino acid ABC transporter permease [Devosia sp.]|uniref:amino acid ABC transporter permease n=1 Tax=Devosia sp. TaxID=1871048 RepID=UPI0032679F1F
MAAENAGRLAPPRTFFLNDPVIRGYFYQGLLIAIVLGLFFWLGANAIQNLTAQGKSLGFEFLKNTAGFDVSFSLIPYDRASSYLDVFYVGLLNTLLVSLISIFLATILGFFLGIARLSTNWLVAKVAAVYVEVTRNIPLLLQLFIWYFAVLKVMPAVKQSHSLGDVIFINQRGVFIPSPIFDDKFVWVLVALVLAIVAVAMLVVWARRRLAATGQRFPVFLTSVAILVILPGAVWLLSGTNVGLDIPKLGGFNFKGGIDLPPELLALIFGLTIYTATFIGEIVRSGIQAVSKGQTEAAAALGLKENDRLRLVIVPQAMRVIIPPLTSEYLSLTKNSSLGAAIAFPELVSIFEGTALNQAGRAIEIVGMTMAVYLTFSLLTSLIMNIYNSRVALVER